MRKFIGYCLIASPFIALFVYTTITASFMIACGVFAVSALIVAVVGAGVHLVDE